MPPGLILIIVGLIIGFIAICLAAINIFCGVSKGPSSEFDGLFKRHLGAIIAMAFGGLLFIIGLVLYGVSILNHIIR